MLSLKNKVKKEIKRLSYLIGSVDHEVGYDNIYHCTVHKAASQWIRGIFEDSIVYKNCGLRPINIYSNGTRSHIYSEKNGLENDLKLTIEKNKIITPIYIDYNTFENKLDKSDNFKAFFVKRDPRDLVVSHYFSKKYSHVMSGNIGEFREKLNELSIENGLIMLIDFLKEDGTFKALESWEKVDSDKIKVIKYEDLIGNEVKIEFNLLFEFLNFGLPDQKLDILLNNYSFENMSKGREKGNENKMSHYRKGVHGDYKNYFTDKVYEYFYDITGDLVTELGYLK